MDTPTTELTPRQRAIQHAVRAGVPDLIAVTYADRLEIAEAMAVAEQQQTAARIEHRQRATHTLVSVCVTLCGVSLAGDLLRAVGGALF